MSPTIGTLSYLFLTVALPAVRCASQAVVFQSNSTSFSAIVGRNPQAVVLAESSLPLFHEAAVYYPPTKSLFVTSDYINDPSIENNQTVSVISLITGDLTSNSTTNVKILDPSSHGIPYPNGGYRYLSSSNVLVWAGQGSLEKDGGLWFLNPEPPYNATQILSAYGVYAFNSPNDVVVVPSGNIYFTDPVYGFEYDFRPPPLLPNQVYRFDPSSRKVRAVADGFGRANAIAVDRDGSTVYIADTGAQVGNGTIDTQAPRTVYAFDVPSQNGLLGNRRLFSFPENGGTKGIKTDTDGNVYVGDGDGVSIYSSEGELLGKVLIEDGIANLGFGEAGVLFAMGDTKLWRIDLSKSVVGSSSLI